MSKDDKFLVFWEWFLKGSGGKSGYQRLFNRWVYFHILIGWALSSLITVDTNVAANTVLLPLVGILIGLAFAWAGNAQALMQSVEIEELAEKHEGGFVDYVYTYQLAILVILTTVVFWSLAGLDVFNKVWPTPNIKIPYLMIKVLLYGMTSMTLRECWHVVLGAQFMLIAQRLIKKSKEGGKSKT